jgi:flagellin FlaB
MKSNGRKFSMNDAAFTGLEAAIVLIAFVVVAAVFSYVMLGAGFFTSQKSKEVVHTGVDQATKSLAQTGDIIGIGSGNNLTGIMVMVELTAGNNPVDLNKTVVSYKGGNSIYNSSVFHGDQAGQIDWIVPATHSTNLLSQYEKAQLNINFEAGEQVGPNSQITLNIAPPAGAVLPISVSTPATITQYMLLY